jgi:muramoyltetrapeptide carboxypeptidase
MGWLAEHYRVRFAPSLFDRTGFLAGSDARRLAELNWALGTSDVRAVVAARGGYGLTRIAHLVNWRALAEQPKWIVGFSDITALHAEAWRSGVASLHGHNVAGLGRGDAPARTAWLSALESPTRRRCLAAKEIWHTGSVSGVLVGGNLTVLASCALAGRLRLPSGCLLAIEDVGESSYRLDRTLSALLLGGALDEVSGIALGGFTDCSPGIHDVPVEAVLRERLAVLRVPMLAGLPFGHGRYNEPVPFGLSAKIDGGRGELVLGAPSSL